MKCIYKAPNNFCLKHSTDGTIEFCVEGPCTDEVMADEVDSQYYDFRRGVSDWTQYVRELKAYNAELAGMVIEYLDDIIPGYRKRAEKAEAQLSQYTASGLEPCDYTAMRNAIDGEKEARQILSETLRALEKSNARAEKAEQERDAAIEDLRACHIEPCDTCKHASAPPKWCEADCESCQWESCRCRDCIGGASQWEWRGVRKEQKT